MPAPYCTFYMVIGFIMFATLERSVSFCTIDFHSVRSVSYPFWICDHYDVYFNTVLLKYLSTWFISSLVSIFRMSLIRRKCKFVLRFATIFSTLCCCCLCSWCCFLRFSLFRLCSSFKYLGMFPQFASSFAPIGLFPRLFFLCRFLLLFGFPSFFSEVPPIVMPLSPFLGLVFSLCD